MKRVFAGVSIGVILATAAAIAVIVAQQPFSSDNAIAADGFVDFVAVDTDVTGNTSPGAGTNDPSTEIDSGVAVPTTIENCTSIAVNDTVDIDVVVDSISMNDRIGSFQLQLGYDGTVVNGSGTPDVDQLLSANSGSLNIPIAQTYDDTAGVAGAAASDFNTPGTDPGEFGNGILVRFTFQGVATGVSPLTFSNLAVVDPSNNNLVTGSSQVLDGLIAVGQACPVATDVSVSSVVTTAPPNLMSGVAFDVDSDVQLSNLSGLDPVNVDTSITLNMPPDCTTTSTNPVTVQDTSVSQAGSPVSLATQTWSVTCTNPSNHTFTSTAVATLDDAAFESNSANNMATSAEDTESLNVDSDIAVTLLELSSDPGVQVSTGQPFSVFADVSTVNNGPFGPTNTDFSVALTLPADCTTTSPNPATIADRQLSVSTPAMYQTLWSVTCTNRSNHNFEATATSAIDQVHVLDPTAGNDSADSGATNIPVFDSADLKLVSTTMTVPESGTVGQPFDIEVSTTRHNNGPTGPVDTDTVEDFIIISPEVCELDDMSGDPVEGVSLETSVDATVESTWTVICSAPGSYNFGIDTSIDVTPNPSDPHIGDPDDENNSALAEGTIVISGEADLKVESVTTTAPEAPEVDEDFEVTVDATLHNNGPLSPAGADVTVTLLDVPEDCTVEPGESITIEGLSLEASTATDMDTQTFTVNCSSELSHTFEASVAIAPSDPNQTDPDDTNDSASAESAVETAVGGPAEEEDGGPSELPDTGGPLGVSSSSWFALLAVLAGLGALSAGAYIAIKRARQYIR